MKKIISILLALGILVGIIGLPVLAETTNNSSDQSLVQLLLEQINKLKTQIEELKAKIEALRQVKSEIKETAQEIKETLKLARQLREGMTGEDVKLLQEILATDPDIYPEGLITGYFGALTRNAVKKLQKLAGLEQVGNVGPKTLSKINELLLEGAGSSGKVPPGLLIAPGIRKKLTGTGIVFQPLPGQVLPPGIEKKLETTTPPIEGVTPPVEGIIF